MTTLSSNSFDFESESEAIEFFIDHGWTDGLPIIPPTLDRVNKFLNTVPYSPSEVIGNELWKN